MNQNQLLALGKVSWLWQNSELHKEWHVGTMSRFVLPAIASDQYLIVEHEGAPVAYCSWAFLDEESEKDYLLTPTMLDPEKWQSGDRLWFIDWISPFSKRYTWALRRELNNKFPEHLARALRVKKENPKARVASFAGKGLDRDSSHSLRRQYFSDLVQRVQQAEENGADIKVSPL